MSLELQVKDLCKRKGITLADLAKQINVQPSSLSQILRGNPTLSKLQDIAAALDVNITELFERRGDFIAFVRRNGETYTFDSERTLKEFAEGLE